MDGEIETQAEFAQAIQDDGLVDWLLQDENEVVPEGPPRDPDTGRFVSSQQEEAQEDTSREDESDLQEEPVETEEVEAEAQIEAEAEEPDELYIELDDTLQTVLERYDGDLNKALRALAEKESMIGRQGNELGELRQELQALRESLQQQPQQQYWGPYENSVEEDPKALLAEALERGDQRTVEIAIRAWGEEEPFEAAAFLMSLQQAQMQAPAPPPVEVGSGPDLETAMQAVVQRHPDVEKYLPHVQEAAKEFPTLRNFMEQGTPAQKAQAFEELLVIVKSRSTPSATSEAVKRVVLRTQEEVRKEKADAAVVSAKNRSAATSQKTGVDAFYEMFDEAAERLAGSGWIHTADE